MENDLYTYTFCREDAERIVQALRVQAQSLYSKSVAVGADTPYSQVCWDEFGIANAIADDIEFKLPE
jgi:hypothetical protein